MFRSAFVGVVVAVLCVSLAGVSVFAESPAGSIVSLNAGPLTRSALAEVARDDAQPAVSSTSDRQWAAVTQFAPGTLLRVTLRDDQTQAWRFVGADASRLSVAPMNETGKPGSTIDRRRIAKMSVGGDDAGSPALGTAVGAVLGLVLGTAVVGAALMSAQAGSGAAAIPAGAGLGAIIGGSLGHGMAGRRYTEVYRSR